MTRPDPSSMLILCRPEFTDSLRDELSDRGIPESTIQHQAPGWLHLSPVDPTLVREPFIFERQRIANARFFPAEQLHPLHPHTVDDMLGDLPRPHRLWTPHTMCPPGDQEPALTRRAEGILRAVQRVGKTSRPDLESRMCSPDRGARRIRDVDVFQLMLTTDGAWTGVHPLSDLSVPYPGGIRRLKQSAEAPSRSTLKLEEAFARMQEEPTEGQLVVDLGAAPGGWSYACARRGARVIAVDHGPLKGWTAESPLVEHLKDNGLTYRPPPKQGPVDWLVADMLIAPALAHRLMATWMDEGLARRFVINVKIPQDQAYRMIKPLADDLRRRSMTFASIRQLYHDRREVTVMAVR